MQMVQEGRWFMIRNKQGDFLSDKWALVLGNSRLWFGDRSDRGFDPALVDREGSSLLVWLGNCTHRGTPCEAKEDEELPSHEAFLTNKYGEAWNGTRCSTVERFSFSMSGIRNILSTTRPSN